jgi:NADPH:quinone reductase-like Zn-dependent oxidoreductase
MKGTVFEKQGAAPVVIDSLEKPKPGPKQVLVKSLWAAINPV